jgi:hypothetical protein
MASKLFVPTDPRVLEAIYIPTDPRDLERFTRQAAERHGKRNREVRRAIRQMQQALQVLPARELDMLFSTKVNGGGQDEIKTRFHVQQSNISYHVSKARERVLFYTKLRKLCSETTLRRLLLLAGVPFAKVRIVLGIIKTTSQTATARHYGVRQGTARYDFLGAIETLKKAELPIVDRADQARAIEMLDMVEQNYSALYAPRPQERWKYKVRESTLTTIEQLLHAV